jgi:hypothetical protein
VCVRFALSSLVSATKYREESAYWIHNVVHPWVDENIEDDCFFGLKWEFSDSIIGEVLGIDYTFMFHNIEDAVLFRLRF